MNNLPAFLSELPGKPGYSPVREAIEELAQDRPEISGVLKLFSSMPPSTGVFANPVRHHQQLSCGNVQMNVDIREFTLRGLLNEEDIVAGSADVAPTIFVGLFGRKPSPDEGASFRKTLGRSLKTALEKVLPDTAQFMKRFPDAAPDIVMQNGSVLRKTGKKTVNGVNPRRAPAQLLLDMLRVHLENAATGAASSFIRGLLAESPRLSANEMCRQARTLAVNSRGQDPFQILFSLLLRHPALPHEARILGRLGCIQIHHGSAGSNMVARYLATLHTRSVSDLFTASQMTLDCARHFGAISDLTGFVRELERTPKEQRDESIRSRVRSGNLPTFGHPELSAAGRDNHLEMDPRPALYLAPLFEAIDAGKVTLRPVLTRRAAILERMYQIAFVEGVEKGAGRLRLAPNTDFGAWLVQEALGIQEPDRTLLSYLYRGFGWMMDVREQLQQPIIRPVIPPDPALTRASAVETEPHATIPAVIASVHRRLMNGNALARQPSCS